MRITWYCAKVIYLFTSATRTGSFQLQFTLQRNDEMLFPKKSGQNLMNVIWMTCRGAKRWVWSCTGLGTTLFLFFLILVLMFCYES